MRLCAFALLNRMLTNPASFDTSTFQHVLRVDCSMSECTGGEGEGATWEAGKAFGMLIVYRACSENYGFTCVAMVCVLRRTNLPLADVLWLSFAPHTFGTKRNRRFFFDYITSELSQHQWQTSPQFLNRFSARSSHPLLPVGQQIIMLSQIPTLI